MATEAYLDAVSAGRTPLSCQVPLIAALLLVSWFIPEEPMFLGELSLKILIDYGMD